MCTGGTAALQALATVGVTQRCLAAHFDQVEATARGGAAFEASWVFGVTAKFIPFAHGVDALGRAARLVDEQLDAASAKRLCGAFVLGSPALLIVTAHQPRAVALVFTGETGSA